VTKIITLNRSECEDLVSACARVGAVAAGAVETLTDADLAELQAAPSPIAFWRKRRGYTQAELAAEVGTTQPFISQIERGTRSGNVRVYVRLAKVLGVRIEDLLRGMGCGTVR